MAASISGASSVILTDCAPSVLDNLQHGLEMNSFLQHIKVCSIDWTDGGSAAADAVGACDIVLAADVLYDPTIVPHFVGVVETLIISSIKTSLNPKIAFVAATLRNAATLEVFFSEVKIRRLPCLELSRTEVEAPWFRSSTFYYDPGSVRLFVLGLERYSDENGCHWISPFPEI